MKEKLIEILELSPTAGKDDIVQAVRVLVATVAARQTGAAEEKAITDLIQQSGGALTREVAMQVLTDRARLTHPSVI